MPEIASPAIQSASEKLGTLAAGVGFARILKICNRLKQIFLFPQLVQQFLIKSPHYLIIYLCLLSLTQGQQ